MLSGLCFLRRLCASRLARRLQIVADAALREARAMSQRLMMNSHRCAKADQSESDAAAKPSYPIAATASMAAAEVGSSAVAEGQTQLALCGWQARLKPNPHARFSVQTPSRVGRRGLVHLTLAVSRAEPLPLPLGAAKPLPLGAAEPTRTVLRCRRRGKRSTPSCAASSGCGAKPRPSCAASSGCGAKPRRRRGCLPRSLSNSTVTWRYSTASTDRRELQRTPMRSNRLSLAHCTVGVTLLVYYGPRPSPLRRSMQRTVVATSAARYFAELPLASLGRD
jgi:hypothetical protein